MAKVLISLSLCFLLSNAGAASGFEAFVSFSQNVNSNGGSMLLRTIKNSLNEASDILHGAIGRRFSKVTFTIPDSWDTSGWNMTMRRDSSGVTNDRPDLLIDDTNDGAFGKFPYAQQYAGCGVPGRQIIIPTAFFSSANRFPKGVALAREWLKYRYGVFDENGFEGDPLYPSYYTLPGGEPSEVKITQCTNAQVVYSFKDLSGSPCSEDDPPLIDRLKSKECHIMPEESSLKNITSSLLYFQQNIDRMKHVCGKDPEHQHNALSPNKHNAMCQGESVWNIVKKSTDFQDETEASGDIEYVYLKEAKPKIVVAWENTAKIKAKGDIILNAIKRLIYDLPRGSKFNGFPFTRTLSDEKDYNLKELNKLEDKNDIMVNIKSDFVKDVDGDINVALAKALDVLSSDPADSVPKGTVIVITKSSGAPDSALLDRLQKSKVCVVLLFLSGGALPSGLDSYVSASNCGSLKDIPASDNEEDIFNGIFAAMEAVLPATVNDKMTETVKTGYLTNETAIVFEADDFTELVTFWVFSDKESENFELRFEGVSEKLNVVKTRDITALSFSPKQAGSIEFAYPHITHPIFTQVRATSRAGKYLKGEIFTRDTSEKSSPDQMPVILYAVLRVGAYPLQNAKVSATIDRPNADSVSLEMFDDGRGDPDITQNDGVYSRYFTQFSEKGEYTITVKVEGNGDSTTYGIDGNAGYQTCCGSTLKASSSKVIVGSRVFQTTFSAKGGRPEKGYKPCRILDLRIENATDDAIVLKWSAPGGEGDSGTASRYGIKFFKEEDNNDDIHEMIRVMDEPFPLNYGVQQEATLQILTKSQSLFVGIVAYNEENKTSDMSNIVQIFEVLKYNAYVRRSVTPRYFIGSVIGSTLIGIMIIIILIAVTVCYLQKKSMYKKEEYNNHSGPDKYLGEVNSAFKTANTPAKAGPVKRTESFEVLLYTHEQVKDCREREKDPPLYDAKVPPKSWSSSDAVCNLQSGNCDGGSASSGWARTLSTVDESEMSEIKCDRW